VVNRFQIEAIVGFEVPRILRGVAGGNCVYRGGNQSTPVTSRPPTCCGFRVAADGHPRMIYPPEEAR